MDDDTMDYVQLWDYIQGMKHFEKIISPEDIILLNELVEGQNFQIALDLLRHRIRPCLKHLPVEIADIARPKKCIKVQPPPFSEEQQPPSLDAFRAFMQTSSLTPFTSLAQNAMSIPPPPPQGTQRNENIYRTSVGSIVPSASSASNNEEDHYIVEENYTSEAFERQKRQELREQQDLEYILSMIADSIKEEKQEANNNEQFEDITNDTKQNDASLNDAPFLKTQTQNEQSKHKKRSPQKTIEIEEPPR